MAFDLVVRNAILPDGRKGQDIGVSASRIAAIEPRLAAEGVRLRATRLTVFRRGRCVARTEAQKTKLSLPGRPQTVDPASCAPG